MSLGCCSWRSSSTTAKVRPGYPWSSGPLRDVVLLHCSFFNLLAGAPSWRPFSDSVAALIVSPSPSGLVPGDDAGGRDVERIIFIGGEGLDCFFQSFLGVLYVSFEDLVVFLFSSRVLDVYCKLTGPFGVPPCSKKNV